jgi:DNA repair ATPase RecN
VFKFLKNKQNIQFIVTVAIVVGSITYSVYLISESEQIEEQIEELKIQLTELNEDKNRVQQLIGDVKERQSTLVGSLREFNELLENRLEIDKELFIQLEQRIAAWQDVLKNADLSSTELTIVQADIADVMQLLKRINETETVDLTESISEQSNSIETD